ncbi:MAG: penicillin-binding protein 1C [Burkholderiales bacterium]|jgi:penicillin-binding protein 1C|nr:penicillin-binding protein 1C [Burkholderiales bacterium]
MRRLLFNVLTGCFLLAVVAIAIRITPHEPLKNATYSTAYYDKHHQLLRLTLAQDDRYRLWTSLDDIAPETKAAVLLYEDRWFYFHPGFNPISLLRGAYVSLIQQSARRGGSTITMQLARLRWNLNTRTLRGKWIQVLRAIQLELFYSKDQILEAYLNEAPYGRNIVGIGAASLIYFNQEPGLLTLPESLTLAVLPQSPTYRIDKSLYVLADNLNAARQRLFALWSRHHRVDDFTRALFSLPLKLRQPEALPKIAPHFTDDLRLRLFLSGRQKDRVNTTLDTSLQRLLEKQVEGYIARHKNRGLSNAAALIVHRVDHSIVAAVGSASYFDDTIGGQINGTTIKRSPGSTLKPFIYALAMDQGIIHPMTVLKDVPTAFSSYTPENFDGEFMGPLTATQALVKSRNVPAVYLNAKIHRPNFYTFLKNAGVAQMASEAHYGLALALGGGEVTQEEVAKLYMMLANDGILHELRREEDEPKSSGLRLLSAESAFMTRDMLSNLPRADSVKAASQKLPIYWKTGTSWGFKDAWSAGIIGDYIVVVWLGNFNNKGAPELIGAKAAAPLFFNIVNAMTAHVSMRDVNAKIPETVTRVDICLASGDLLTTWCQRKGQTWFIPGVSPIKVDTVYRPVYFDPKTHQPLCPEEVRPDSLLRVYEYYDSDIRAVFASAGFPKREPPDLRRCQKTWNTMGSAPYVITPLKNTRYTIFSDDPRRNQIPLTAGADAEVNTLYWFENNVLIGKASPKTPLLWQPKTDGFVLLSVVDDHGRSDTVSVQVVLARSSKK